MANPKKLKEQLSIIRHLAEKLADTLKKLKVKKFTSERRKALLVELDAIKRSINKIGQLLTKKDKELPN